MYVYIYIYMNKCSWIERLAFLQIFTDASEVLAASIMWVEEDQVYSNINSQLDAVIIIIIVLIISIRSTCFGR